MKKQTWVLLVVLVLSILSMSAFATGDNDKPYAGTKILFSSFQTGDVEKDWVENQFKRFTEETGIEVEHVYIAHGDTVSTLMTRTAAGIAPDCAMMSHNYVNSLSAKGLLVDLNAFIKGKNISYDMGRFFPKLLGAYTYQGNQFALPSDMDLGLLWYNKEIFDKQGIPYPTASMTWEEYKETAKKLTYGAGPGKVYGSEMPSIQHLLWQAGADYLSEDGKTCTINTPEAKKAYQFVMNMIDEGICVRPGSEGVGLTSKRAAMSLGSGPWYAHYVLGEVEFAWGVAPLPHDKFNATTAYGSAFGILESSKNKEAAFEFITWLLSDEQQYIRAKAFSWFPPASTVVNVEGFNDVEVLNMTAEQKAMVLAEAAYGRAPVVVEKANEVAEIIRREETLIWANEKSIDDALKTMEEDINKLL